MKPPVSMRVTVNGQREEVRTKKSVNPAVWNQAKECSRTIYSKIERGDRRAKREQVIVLANLLQVDKNELLTLWLADQIIAVITDEKEIAGKALKVVNDNLNKKE
ncbi:hypothetical protein Barb6_00048 [Bacteroidales bacterium Barb6]|nr:hypothetical protein Barb6_00048 [Bacteroidales bacterium Barb6]